MDQVTETKDLIVVARELIIELRQDRTSALCKAVTHKVVAAKAEHTIASLCDEVEQLRHLIIHMHVHSAYRDNGYLQMTTEQKAFYDAVWERSVAEADEEERAYEQSQEGK